MNGPTFDPDFATAEVTIKYRVMCRRTPTLAKDICEGVSYKMQERLESFGSPIAGMRIHVVTDAENVASMAL